MKSNGFANSGKQHDLFYLRDLVEPSEELVEGRDQLGGRQLFREGSEVDDVGVENAKTKETTIKIFALYLSLVVSTVETNRD
jgi:hypothetical protein